MLKRILLVALSLALLVGIAPLALANGDCGGDDSHYARAVQLHDMGDYARAERHYNCALADDPDNPTIPILIENLYEDIASAPTAWSRPVNSSLSADAPDWQAFVMPDWLTPYELVPSPRNPQRTPQATAAEKPPALIYTYNPDRVYELPVGATVTVHFPPQDMRDEGLSFEEYVEFANWFSKRGEWPRAIKSLRRALDLQPRHFNLRCRLGALHRAQGEDDAAMRQFELVLANDPGNTCAVENRADMLSAARPIPAAAAAPQPPSPAQPLVERAMRFHEQNKLFAAANALILALAEDPAHIDARCQLGMIFSDWASYGRALREFEHILAADAGQPCAYAARQNTVRKMLQMYVPLTVDDYFFHARSYQQVEDWEFARDAYELGLARDATRNEVRCQLGVVYAQLGDERAALEQFDRVLEHDSLDACARPNRDALMQRLRDG